MHADRTLAEEFLALHPAEAARVLDDLPSARLADLFNELPLPLAAVCLRSVALPKSAEILAAVTADRAAQVFEALQTHEVAAALRPLAPERRDELLSGMPPGVSEPIRRLLRHPEGTAGALMDPRVPAFPGDIGAVEARSLLRSSSPHAMYYVYVVDRDHRLIGVLNLRQLMLTSSNHSLEALMRRRISSLQSTADRAAILGHPGWREVHALPVVDPAGRFLGALRHETVRQLEAEGPTGRQPARALGAALAFGELCWVTWSKAIGGLAALTLTPPVRRRGKPRGRP